MYYNIIQVKEISLSELGNAGEGELGWPRHVNVVVWLSPFDHQRASREVYLTASVHLALKDASDDGGASARTAGQCSPGSSLPHYHTNVTSAKYLNKLRNGGMQILFWLCLKLTGPNITIKVDDHKPLHDLSWPQCWSWQGKLCFSQT